ncbi:MAG: hypothetical protein V2I32_12445, partial [Desulforhopalus sp.]|nr:hypothetical protein [Desulforhopalus sp.]
HQVMPYMRLISLDIPCSIKFFVLAHLHAPLLIVMFRKSATPKQMANNRVYFLAAIHCTTSRITLQPRHLSRHVFHRFRRLSKPFLLGKSFCQDYSTEIPSARIAVVG